MFLKKFRFFEMFSTGGGELKTCSVKYLKKSQLKEIWYYDLWLQRQEILNVSRIIIFIFGVYQVSGFSSQFVLYIDFKFSFSLLEHLKSRCVRVHLTITLRIQCFYFDVTLQSCTLWTKTFLNRKNSSFGFFFLVNFLKTYENKTFS